MSEPTKIVDREQELVWHRMYRETKRAKSCPREVWPYAGPAGRPIEGYAQHRKRIEFGGQAITLSMELLISYVARDAGVDIASHTRSSRRSAAPKKKRAVPALDIPRVRVGAGPGKDYSGKMISSFISDRA